LAIFSCKALNWALHGKPPIENSTDEFDKILEPFIQERFLKEYSPEDIADCCMMALTMVSYIIPKRVDLVKIFDDTLNDNFDKITSSETILLRSRLCLLLGYYADMVFSGEGAQMERFKQTLRFLVTSMALTGDERAVAKQAADTMHTVVSD
jgi:hypothetical protein